MRILVSNHPHYNYLDSTISAGLLALGHDVRSIYTHQTNYVSQQADSYFAATADLYVEFINRDTSALKHCPSVLCWGEDHHNGLDKAFSRGFDFVFVRDHLSNEPGIPISFAIEERYIDVTKERLIPLNEREIDVCFVGQIGYGNRREYVERLKQDFKDYNLVLGERQFNEPDEKWSKWTLPWAAHDVRYFEMLANSKAVLSFKGFGIFDCGRHWEVLASGGVPIIENVPLVDMVRPTPEGVSWFVGYEQLGDAIHVALTNANSPSFQEKVNEAWKWNCEHHSTAARARYLLQQIGMADA